MKKVLSVSIVALFIFLFSACSSNIENDEIIIPDFDQNLNIHQAVDVENEVDYSNIIATTDKEIYSKNDESIKIKILNQNVGKGFYIYSTPTIQKNIKGKWINIEYKGRDMPQWFFIGEEGNNTDPNFTYLYVFLEDIKKDLTFGEYRVVIFTKEKTLYSEFAVE